MVGSLAGVLLLLAMALSVLGHVHEHDEHGHSCIHDLIEHVEITNHQNHRNHPWDSQEPADGEGRHLGAPADFETIRISVSDWLLRDDSGDFKMCTAEGQKYKYRNGNTIYTATCGKDDVASVSKRSYLTNTIIPRASVLDLFSTWLALYIINIGASVV